MPTYAAFLGHQPHVSLAELRASIPTFRLQRTADGGSIAIFAASADLSPALLATLGGTILLAEELSGSSVTPEAVPQLLQEAVAPIKGKITFGLRCKGLPPARVRALYRTCKEALRRAGRPCRYIGNERQPAHFALLRASGVLDGRHGIELAIVADGENLWFGKTIAAHNPTQYAQRDIGKPARDMRAGILPPKLAQVMLNLGAWLLQSGQRTDEQLAGSGKRAASVASPAASRQPPAAPVVLDPFCGSGVIPMECLLRGWMVLASDSSQKAVDACKRNIAWTRRTFALPAANIPSAVSKHNAEKPFDFSSTRDERLRCGPSVIVTETSLGPSLRARPSQQETQRLRTANEKLQAAFLRNAAASLPGVPIVCTWPVWFLKTGPLFLEKVWKEAEKMGLQAVLPPETPPTSSSRPTLLYRRPDQYVGREIVLFRSSPRPASPYSPAQRKPPVPRQGRPPRLSSKPRRQQKHAMQKKGKGRLWWLPRLRGRR